MGGGGRQLAVLAKGHQLHLSTGYVGDYLTHSPPYFMRCSSFKTGYDAVNEDADWYVRCRLALPRRRRPGVVVLPAILCPLARGARR